MVNAVYASSSFTSIAWTVLSLEPGRGLQAALTPPIADAAPPRRAYNPISAGGPQIKAGAGRSVWRARLVTTKLAGLGALECLCTNLRSGGRGAAPDWAADACDHQFASPAAGHRQG